MNFISGGLTKIQEILADPGSVLQECHHYQQLLYRRNCIIIKPADYITKYKTNIVICC